MFFDRQMSGSVVGFFMMKSRRHCSELVRQFCTRLSRYRSWWPLPRRGLEGTNGSRFLLPAGGLVWRGSRLSLFFVGSYTNSSGNCARPQQQHVHWERHKLLSGIQHVVSVCSFWSGSISWRGYGACLRSLFWGLEPSLVSLFSLLSCLQMDQYFYAKDKKLTNCGVLRFDVLKLRQKGSGRVDYYIDPQSCQLLRGNFVA